MSNINDVRATVLKLADCGFLITRDSNALRALLADHARLQADAERYRWLRDECVAPYSLIAEHLQCDFDAVIDAAKAIKL